MKTAKKLFAAFLAVMMIAALAIPAFADGEEASGDSSSTTTEATTNTGSITIIPKDNGAHNFTAYQIFAGEVSNSRVLSNVEWGSALPSSSQSKFLTALKELTETVDETKTVGSYFSNCTTAAGVAEALDKLAADADQATAAKAVVAALSQVESQLQGGNVLTKGNDGRYKVTDIDVGYYLVKDTVDEDATGAKASDMLLEVIGDVTLTAKADIPEVTKKADKDSYGIGDEITYTLTATVPDYDSDTDTRGEDYAYKLEFADTMSDALALQYTYQGNVSEPTGGITVKLGNVDVTSSFTISYNTATRTLTVSCSDISKIDGVSAESVFTVTYKAKINSAYTAGAVGNTVTLVTKDYTSPEIIENVFPINLQVLKVDGAKKDENGSYTTPLTGAQFTLQNGDGSYLHVNDGGKVNGWVDENSASTLTTDGDGKINVIGLAAGTYTLTETVAPAKYNLANLPFTLVINAEVDQAGGALDTLTISVNGGTVIEGEDGTVTATIENNQGAQLPSTGGMGTTIFYVVGGILVVGAVVLLVTRKRMDEE